ncbi:zinc-dependent metalloprotease family protein [Siphonobacter sp.]|uniref:zinc-dependent metalloprotease family protein n=1 Tax=Siphonobacter sp. TaxID=1869184 RepID=UPI003B3B3327
MKNFTILFTCLLLSFYSYGQIILKPASKDLGTDDYIAVSKKLTKFNTISIQPKEIKDALQRNRMMIKLTLQVNDTLKFDITLEENDIRSPNYKSYESSGSDKKEVAKGECVTYKGVVNNEPSSYARLLITDETIEGLIFDKATGYYYLQPLKAFSKGTVSNSYIFYNLADAKETDGVCGADAVSKVLKGQQMGIPKNAEASRVATTCRVLEIATDSDYEFTLNNGGNPNATILGILNTVDGVYQSDLNVKIVVVYQHAYTSPADPYVSFDPGIQLNELRNNWNSNFTFVARDVTHLFTGKVLLGGTLGIGYVGTVCSNPSLAYAITMQDIFEAYTTAHEIGHNLGGNHSDATGPDCIPNRTVMCQGNNLPTFTFSNNSRNEINNYINSNSGCILNFDNLEIAGPSIICSNSSGTFSVPNLGSTAISWSSSYNISLNTSSGTSVTGSTFNDASPGWVSASFTALTSPSCVVTNTKNVWLGRPDIYTIRYDNNIPTNTFNYVSAGVYHTAYANLSNLIMANLPGNINWNPSPYIGYSHDQYFHKYSFNLAPGEVLYFNPMSATNTCGTTQRTLAFGTTSGFRLANNPAKDKVELVFDNTKFVETLPERVLIYDEKISKPIRDIQIDREFQAGKLNNNRLSIPVEDLHQGIYYLHVVPKRESKEEITRIRLLVE